MEKMFKIDGRDLYLEKTLVEYDNAPIYFVCKSFDALYLCLCIDMDEGEYYVVETNDRIISDMLHKKLTMREAFLANELFWDIKIGDQAEYDVVKKEKIEEINREVLPVEGAVFNTASDDLRDYRKKVDTRLEIKTGLWENIPTVEDVISEEECHLFIDAIFMDSFVEKMDSILRVNPANLAFDKQIDVNEIEFGREQCIFKLGYKSCLEEEKLNISSAGNDSLFAA